MTSLSAYRLHTVSSGEGPPVVLLHGLTGSSSYWCKLAPQLALTRRVVALDLLGFGRSPKPRDVGYTLADHTASVAATLDGLKLPEPLVLVGHSLGALIALHYAAVYPRQVARLVLVAPPVYGSPGEARHYIRRSRSLPGFMLYGRFAQLACTTYCHFFNPLSRRLAPLYLPDLPKPVAAATTDHTWRSYSNSLLNVLERQNRQPCRDLGMTGAQVEILYGDKDALMARQRLEALSKCRQDVQITRLAGSHHLPLEHPRAVAAAVEAG
ncbi:alpha/beta hydrolase [Candidatus Parcubacteria bacterium]|nr:alpha/beta hydrolase [Candidatus Parcubacteria bacterium]